MSYIFGHITPVPTANREAFRTHCRSAAKVVREHGCTSFVECWGDDVPPGKVTDFHRAVQAGPDETVVFSWMTWPSQEAAEQGMQRAMEDPRLSPEANPMPFDGKRLVHGGFTPLLELGERRAGGYVDGFVAPVPVANRAAFEELARTCDPIFMEHGACWIMEAWGTWIPEGKVTDFRRAVQATEAETVVFSWVQWPDRATRDAGNQRIMEDPRMSKVEMPFDGRRLIYGGFVPLVEG